MKKNEKTRYIDTAKLIKSVKKQVEDEDDIEDIIYLINETPTEDVAPIVLGKWIKCGTNYKCSNCGKHDDIEGNYCWFCGAKMEGDTYEKKVL